MGDNVAHFGLIPAVRTHHYQGTWSLNIRGHEHYERDSVRHSQHVWPSTCVEIGFWKPRMIPWWSMWSIPCKSIGHDTRMEAFPNSKHAFDRILLMSSMAYDARVLLHVNTWIDAQPVDVITCLFRLPLPLILTTARSVPNAFYLPIIPQGPQLMPITCRVTCRQGVGEGSDQPTTWYRPLDPYLRPVCRLRRTIVYLDSQ